MAEMSAEAVEAKRSYHREYRRKNREKINAKRREWRANNRDKVQQCNKRYWEKQAKDRVGISSEGNEVEDPMQKQV